MLQRLHWTHQEHHSSHPASLLERRLLLPPPPIGPWFVRLFAQTHSPDGPAHLPKPTRFLPVRPMAEHQAFLEAPREEAWRLCSPGTAEPPTVVWTAEAERVEV